MNDYYVYVFLDPQKDYNVPNEFGITKEPFYVGCGHKNRCTSHLYPSILKKTKRPFYFKLNKLINNNVKPIIIKLYENLSQKDAYYYEHLIIMKLGTRFDKKYHGTLLNLNLGGQGGISPSEDVIKRISEKRRKQSEKFSGKNNPNYKNRFKYFGENNPFYGKHHDTETILKMKRSYWIFDRYGKCYDIDDIELFCKENMLILTKLRTKEKRKPKEFRHKGYIAFSKKLTIKTIVNMLNDYKDHILNVRNINKNQKEEILNQVKCINNYFDNHNQ